MTLSMLFLIAAFGFACAAFALTANTERGVGAVMSLASIIFMLLHFVSIAPWWN